MDNKNLFVYAECRPTIRYIPDTMRNGALACGWSFMRFNSFELGDLTDDDKMEKLFPSNSGTILRNLGAIDPSAVMALGTWLRRNNRVTVNFNAVGGLSPSNDKQFAQMLLLNDPRTREYINIAYSVEGVDDVLELIKKGRLKYPLLLKPRNGSLGQGIKAIFKKDDLLANKNWKMMAAQQYIESDYDWRVYVIGGTAIGALRRGGKEGKEFDFEAQAQSRGIEVSYEGDAVVYEKIGKIAAAAAAVVGLEFSGIDIICDKKTGKYYILEANTSPTWVEKYNKLMGLDVSIEVTRWMEERLKAKKEPKNVAIRDYIERRLSKLPRRVQRRYLSILEGTECSRTGKGNDLTSRLHRCYDRLFTKGDNLSEAKCLLDEVESMPLCWAGNFIGSATWGEDGVLEDGCIPSAYYLAIREKYDIMAQVKSKD